MSEAIIRRLARHGFIADLDRVAERYGVTRAEVLERNRIRAAGDARRELYIHIRKTRPDLSMEDIGLLFERHHSTIVYAVNTRSRKKHNAYSARRWANRKRPDAPDVNGIRAALRVV